MPFEPSLALTLGQEVFYAGFPLRMWSNGGALMNGRPLPLVKRGTLAAGWDPESSVKCAYIDTMSTKGFSGGPLVFADRVTGEFKLAGVVSKYRTEYEQVLDASGADTGHKVESNTGLMVAYGVNHVLDIIRRNPIGLPINAVA